jgi:hypothetical protein
MTTGVPIMLHVAGSTLIGAAEAALRPLVGRIDVDSRGNSHQDLRLSLLGWWPGEAVRRGSVTGGPEVAAWIRAHLRA